MTPPPSKFNFSKIFINRPRLAGVIAVVVVLAGIISIRNLPVAQYPQVTPPQIVVNASYPGASASVLASTVGAPIEDAVNGVEDMLYMSSSSDSSGSYSLTITFAVGTDPDMAQVKVQNRVARAEPLLPVEVTQQGVTVETRSSDILGFVMIRSPKGTLDGLFMSDYANNRIKPVLERLNGISAADLFSSKYSMRVWMDTDRIASLGLSMDEIVNAIRQQNVQASLGSVGGVPGDGSAQMVYSLQAKGRLNTPEEFGNIIVRTADNGAVLRLKDIARIELGADSYLRNTSYNGASAIGMRLTRKPGSNALDTVDKVYERISEMNKQLPDDMEILVPYDATSFVRASIKEIILTLLITGLLTVFICYIFLQDWRATLIPSITIPVSLLGTFAILMAMGYSINTLTLFALILAIGVVVDDAIVVVERVLHLMEEEGLDHRTATLKSMEQVSGAIIATTLVLLSIFVPVGFVAGITGKIYQQFAVTISAAVLLSSVTALTLSPALCSIMLNIPKERKHGPLFWFNNILNRTRIRYVSVVGWLSRRILLTIIFLLAALGSIIFIVKISPTSFLPNEDQGVIFGAVQLPEGATVARTEALLEQVTNVVRKDPAVRFSLGVTGFSIMGGSGENVAFLLVGLKDWEERKTPALQIKAVQQRLSGQLGALSDAQINLFTPPAIMGLGRSGGLSLQLQAVGDSDPIKLESALNGFLMHLNMSPEIMYAFSSYTAQTPNLFLDVDRTKALMLNVPVNTIFNTLRNYLGSYYVNDINKNGQICKVIVQADWINRKNPDDINELYVQSLDGNQVPLKSLVKINTILAPRTINRFNKFSAASISAVTMPGTSSGDAMAKVESLAAKHLDGNYTFEWSDMSYQEKNTSGESAILIVMALIFGYLFLVAQFESWTAPISIMTSISIAILGALLGLKFLNMSLSIYAQLGLILLVGLASKNAILIVEFSKTQNEHGMGIVESAMDGARQRFRAVLMTAFTFIFGVLPMVLATGAGAASRRSIGTTVFWGMLAATLAGIIMVPALYTTFQKMRESTHNFRIKRAQLQTMIILLLPLIFSSCKSVGPDFKSPVLPEIPQTYKDELNISNWWNQFNDPALNEMIEKAQKNNLDLKSAIARLNQARAQLGIDKTLLTPTFDMTGQVIRSQTSDNAGGNGSVSLYDIGFDADWEIDLFGGSRRSIEAAFSSMEAWRMNLADVMISVTAETAQAYLRLRTYQFRLEVARSNLAIQKETLDIMESRLKTGLANELSFQQASYNYQNTCAVIPTLEEGVETSKNALSVLIGEMPGKLEISPYKELPSSDLNLKGIPADLLRRRPDVQKAERELAAQTALVGVAVAELYPKFTLKASIGLETLTQSTLFESGSERYSIIPGVEWPLFHFGAIRKKIKVQKAILEQSLTAYENSVLNAVKEVRDALTACQKEYQRRDALKLAVAAAKAAEEVAKDQYNNGLTDFNNVLDAQRSLLGFEEQLAISEGQVGQNVIRLYKALGGGWQSAN